MVRMISTINASDGFALAMLGVMALAMGIIVLLFYSMKRHVARRDPHVDALLEELEAEERETVELAKTKSAHPWERETDWWKKD